MNTTAMNLRHIALRRSLLRDYVNTMLTETHNVHASSYDQDGIVMDLEAMKIDVMLITPATFWDIAARHEFDERGMTDAMLLDALDNGQTGWVAMIRRPGQDVETLNLKKGTDATAQSIEATLREFVSFPEGTSIMILPLVG